MGINFALIGVGGYVAPRHLEAIKTTGNKIVAAVDKNDSVGILDKYSLGAVFFLETERFYEYIYSRRDDPERRITYVSICSPNYLHFTHCYLSMLAGADVICEKPLVINPEQLNNLINLENETGKKVYGVSQLRFDSRLIQLKKELENTPNKKHDVLLTYITSRGNWYKSSWKGYIEKSGGLALNIGVHLLDLIIWLFGSMQQSKVYLSQSDRMSGYIELDRANVKWFLSTCDNDSNEINKNAIYRSLQVDGTSIDFSELSDGLHTELYKNTLKGNGLRIKDLEQSVLLAHSIQTKNPDAIEDNIHPLLLKRRNEWLK